MKVPALPLCDDISPAPENSSCTARGGSSSSSSSIYKTATVYCSLDTTAKQQSSSRSGGQTSCPHSQQLSAQTLLHTTESSSDEDGATEGGGGGRGEGGGGGGGGGGGARQDSETILHEGTKEQDCDQVEGWCSKFTSCRWTIGYLCCAARFSQSAIRQCIGMAVVCMTVWSPATVGPHTSRPAEDDGVTVSSGADGGVTVNSSSHAMPRAGAEVRFSEFTWSPEFEGLILNAFNIGFFFSPILGGHIAGKFGGKRVVLVALLAGSTATICLPLAARYNDIFVFVLRVIAGIFLGVVDPAIQALWARWAPKHEKAQLTTCSYTGLSLAGIVTFFISGYICGIELQNGWPFIFYFFGGFGLMITIPWVFLVYDSPDQHPRILDSERLLIAKDKGHDEAHNKKLSTPWRRMLTSGPLWAIVMAHMFYTWVTSWMMAYIPKYLSDVMKFDVDEDGLYSSLPYVGRLVSGFVASYLSDLVIRSGRLSTTATRKLFQTAGCLGCGVCTLAVGFVDHTARGAAVSLLVLAMSLQNLTSVAFRINHLDIAPRYAGVMMGMTVTAGMAFSLTGPPITAAIIKEGSSSEWQSLFTLVAAMNVLGAVVFLLLGSGEVQDWAQPPKTDYSPIPVVTVNTITAHPPTPWGAAKDTTHRKGEGGGGPHGRKVEWEGETRDFTTMLSDDDHDSSSSTSRTTPHKTREWEREVEGRHKTTPACYPPTIKSAAVIEQH